MFILILILGFIISTLGTQMYLDFKQSEMTRELNSIHYWTRRGKGLFTFLSSDSINKWELVDGVYKLIKEPTNYKFGQALFWITEYPIWWGQPPKNWFWSKDEQCKDFRKYKLKLIKYKLNKFVKNGKNTIANSFF